MSNKQITKSCLVIDASIAHSAGGFQSKHPKGTTCRDTLLRIKNIGYRMAWGNRMKEEWDRHLSGFSVTWLQQMMSMGKLIPVNDEPDPTHLATIQAYAADPNLVEVMTKDTHLLAAAILRDQRILSLDDKIRHHFAGKLRAHAEVLDLVWVNPSVPEEEAIEWLNEGAPMDTRRTPERWSEIT